MLNKLSIAVLAAMTFSASVGAQDLSASLKVDVSQLRGDDGQLLIQLSPEKMAPARPADPKSLSENEAGYWFDREFAGMSGDQQKSVPSSPADGAIGKKVAVMVMGPHPYFEALMSGFNKVADAYQWEVKVLDGNWSLATQKRQSEELINERPDMIFVIPTDTKAIAPIFRRISKAGIPVFSFNGLPSDKAQEYAIGWTGPDDWGQMRELSRKFADKLGKEGGYAIVRHNPGSSPFFARTFAPITELATYAPKMKLLDMAPGGFDAAKVQALVSAWTTKYGKDLKGLILAGDGVTLVGAQEALKNAGRDDIVVVAAGHSKVGMDAVKAGDAYAITMQSANSDGAVAAKVGADWFNGVKIPKLTYLKTHIITKDDVSEFYPAQW